MRRESPQETIETRQVLFEKAGVKVSLIDMDSESAGLKINLLVENSSNQGITVQTRYTSINGFMINKSLYCGVTPGNKALTALTFSGASLEEYGIGTIGTVEIVFEVKNGRNGNALFKTDTVTIETPDVKSANQDTIKTKQVLFEQDVVKVSLIDMDREILKLFIENDSNKAIAVRAIDTYVNGFMVNGSMYCKVMPGKKEVSTLSFSGSSLKEYGIRTIGAIEIAF